MKDWQDLNSVGRDRTKTTWHSVGKMSSFFGDFCGQLMPSCFCTIPKQAVEGALQLLRNEGQHEVAGEVLPLGDRMFLESKP